MQMSLPEDVNRVQKGKAMKKISRIMVPVAFSEHSADQIRYAASLAAPLEAELILVNIINERDVETVQKITSYGYSVDEEHYVRELESERVAQLDAMLADIDFPDDRVRVIFRVGRPADSILRLAVREEADMIVMGIRDRSDFLHSLTGSVAEKIFRRSPVTVVSYRDEKNAGYLRKRLEK
jgi:nucleotide-binding universal stress UspA family protein